MNTIVRHTTSLLLAAACLGAAGCSTIIEDRSECPCYLNVEVSSRYDLYEGPGSAWCNVFDDRNSLMELSEIENINEKDTTLTYAIAPRQPVSVIVTNTPVRSASIIAGIGCRILTPNGFIGTVKDSYTAAEWATAESDFGLVALPLAGNCVGDYLVDNEDQGNEGQGRYWSSTPWHDENPSLAAQLPKKAMSTIIFDQYYSYQPDGSDTWNRDNGCSIRLVKVIDPGN